MPRGLVNDEPFGREIQAWRADDANITQLFNDLFPNEPVQFYDVVTQQWLLVRLQSFLRAFADGRRSNYDEHTTVRDLRRMMMVRFDWERDGADIPMFQPQERHQTIVRIMSEVIRVLRREFEHREGYIRDDGREGPPSPRE